MRASKNVWGTCDEGRHWFVPTFRLQVRICKRALPALLRLNIDPKSSTDVLTFTSGILHNLSKNPTNTTAFYKVSFAAFATFAA